MKRNIILLICTIIANCVNAQKLYSKSYGSSTKNPIIFIHGGPSGNSTLFEATTAQELANKGFFVIVYDRRGEGRSIDTTAKFTYEEYFKDLNLIYDTYKINKANLIGHSFGGLVATLFSEKYPEKVSSLILAGALISQQETYDHILKTVNEIYLQKKDTLMQKRVAKIILMNKKTSEYRKECFDLANHNGYFKMPNATTESQKLRKQYDTSEFFKNNIRNTLAPVKFYKNETQTNINTKPILQILKKQGVQLFAIYGEQDKIFSTGQLNDLKKIIKKQNFEQIDNCSHYLFVDQQELFIATITKWIKK